MFKEKTKRAPIIQKAKKIAQFIKDERPDYNYMRKLFQLVREELDIVVMRKGKKLPYVPTEEELKSLYKTVWKSRNIQNAIIVKTLVYTGVRVSEFINIKINDVDFEACQIRIRQGKGKKDRIVPFPYGFKEILAIHANTMLQKGAIYLFESIRKKLYTDRGIRKILANYAKEAGLPKTISPHKLRHFLFTWLKKQGMPSFSLIQAMKAANHLRYIQNYLSQTLSLNTKVSSKTSLFD